MTMAHARLRVYICLCEHIYMAHAYMYVCISPCKGTHWLETPVQLLFGSVVVWRVISISSPIEFCSSKRVRVGRGFILVVYRYVRSILCVCGAMRGIQLGPLVLSHCQVGHHVGCRKLKPVGTMLQDVAQPENLNNIFSHVDTCPPDVKLTPLC